MAAMHSAISRAGAAPRGSHRRRLSAATLLLLPVTAAMAVVLGSGAPAGAAACDAPTHTWTSTVSNEWSTASNWSTGTVPGATSKVCVPDNPSLVVPRVTGTALMTDLEAPRGLVVPGTLQVSGTGVVGSLTLSGRLTGGGQVDLTEDSTFTGAPTIEAATMRVVSGVVLDLPDTVIYLGPDGTIDIAGELRLTGTPTIYWPYAGQPDHQPHPHPPSNPTAAASPSPPPAPCPSPAPTPPPSTSPSPAPAPSTPPTAPCELTAAGAQPWAGTMRATDPGQLILNDPDWALATGANLDNITVQNNLALTGNATATSTELNSATITGPGTLALAGTSQITNTFIRDNATLRVATGATLNLPDTVIYLGPDGTIDIAGELRLTGTPTIYWPYAGQPGRINLTPTGTLTKTDPTNATVDVPLTGSGLVRATEGTLSLAGGGTYAGEIRADAGATTRITNDTLTLQPGATLTRATIAGGTVTTDTTVTWTNGTMTSGQLTGTGTINLSGTFAWSGGTMSGTGTTVVTTGTTATATGHPG